MILERIRQQYPHLTRSQRRLADFLVDGYQAAAFMTASRLAEAVGVNEATVIRFAQRLGYRGFPEMLEAIQEIVHQDLTPGAHIGEEGPAEAPFFAALAAEADLLQRTARQTPLDRVMAFRQALGAAAAIVVVGQGRAAWCAEYLAEALLALGLPVRGTRAGSPGLATLLAAAGGDTTVVGVALDDGDERVARALEWARRRGARALALADSAVSPAARAAEVALTSGSAGDEAAPALAPLVAMVDALVRSLAEENAEAVRRRAEGAAQARRYVLTGQDEEPA